MWNTSHSLQRHLKRQSFSKFMSSFAQAGFQQVTDASTQKVEERFFAYFWSQDISKKLTGETLLQSLRLVNISSAAENVCFSSQVVQLWLSCPFQDTSYHLKRLAVWPDDFIDWTFWQLR